MPPFIDLRLQLFASLPFKRVLLLQSGINFAVLDLVLLELPVQLLAKDLDFLRFFTHAFFLKLQHVAPLSKLPNLHLIALIVMHLAFIVLGPYPPHLDLPGKAFYLNALEDYNKIELG